MSAFDLLLAHLALTWALVGLIWTVQLVQYPGFTIVGEAEFDQFHDHYSSRIAWIVGPLMFGELLTGLALFWNGPTGLSPGLLWTGLGLIVLNWVWTACVAVPLHARLSGPAQRPKQVLVRANWVRTLAWSARGIWTLVVVRAALVVA